MVKSPLFEIIAGTYEEFLLGYYYSKDILNQSFAAHDHSSSVRCVSFSDRYLASGGTDDRIFIYDLNTRKQLQTLTHHEATVNCLQFTENHSHLISGSSDGVLAIVRVGNWQVEKLWEKAHKGSAILDIAVHSSGKLALTLGANCTLCTWNLVKGRQAYIINLRSKSKDARSLEKILWANDGVRFILYGGKCTELWSIETGGILKQTEHNEKVTLCTWLNDDILLVGHEDGEISVLNIQDDSIDKFKAHNDRIKGIAFFKKRIVTCSSNGEIKVWKKSFKAQAVVQTGCRLTCLTAVPAIKVKDEETTEDTEIEIKIEDTEEEIAPKENVIIEIEDDDNDLKKGKKKKSRNNDTEKIPKKRKKKQSL